jgi:hypothetical protein
MTRNKRNFQIFRGPKRVKATRPVVAFFASIPVIPDRIIPLTSNPEVVREIFHELFSNTQPESCSTNQKWNLTP